MKHVAFPFLVLDEARVRASGWRRLEPDGSALELGSHIEGWDYARDIRVERSVLIDHDIDSSVLALDPADTAFDLIIRLGTGPGSMPRRIMTLQHGPIRPGIPVLIDQMIAGAGLSQRLFLESTIVLREAGLASSRLSPRLPGSILWRDVIDVALEGQAPRFPMEVVSFAERFPGRAEKTAPWFLHWLPGQLHRDFGGAVRLFLNHDRRDFIERFVAADPLILQVALADVITQILGQVIRQEDLGEILAEAEPTSVAGHVATWLDLAFPGLDIAGVRTLHEASPGRFHAAILAMADPQIMRAGQ
jgi:hypothetical protein